MNERIKQLIAQAKFIAEETINRQISSNLELNTFAEKFAQLIIRACGDFTDPITRNLMMKNFGVEE